MKKHGITFTLAIAASLLFTTSTSAATLTEDEYNRLNIIFSDARISVMTDEEAQTYLSYDLEGSKVNNKYYKVTETTNGTINEEVTKEEALNAENESEITRGASYSTSYKQIQISESFIGSNRYLVRLANIWLGSPKVKSYDVIGIRTSDATVVDGTQSGTQMYRPTTQNYYSHVTYSANGANIRKASNGFGISMNLVDEGAYFESDIQAYVDKNTQYGEVFGSYQHAVKNVTLAQSKAYTISHNGYGKVLNFSTSVESYYDGMAGVNVKLG